MGSRKNDARIESMIKSPSSKKQLLGELDKWTDKIGLMFDFDQTKLTENDLSMILIVIQKTYERGYQDGAK